MKYAFELSTRQMKNVIGGGVTDPKKKNPDEDPTHHHCFIDGEIIFETICTTDEQCQNIYGPKAECY